MYAHLIFVCLKTVMCQYTVTEINNNHMVLETCKELIFTLKRCSLLLCNDEDGIEPIVVYVFFPLVHCLSFSYCFIYSFALWLSCWFRFCSCKRQSACPEISFDVFISTFQWRMFLPIICQALLIFNPKLPFSQPIKRVLGKVE